MPMSGRLARMDLAKVDLPGRELHAALAEARERAPVVRVDFGGRKAWLIVGHDALRSAFKDEAAFPAGEWYRRAIEPTQGRTFESMDGPEHHLVRRLATPAFRSRAVSRMEREGLAELAHELVDTLGNEERIDLFPAFVARFPFLVISRMLGVPAEREQDFVSWAAGILRFDGEAAQQFTNTLLPVLEARRKEPRDDVLSELCQVEIEGRRFEDEEVLSHIRLLFSAGATTTMDALGNLLFALFTHPQYLDRARDDMDFLVSTINELIRWETPVAILPRLCLPGTRLAGETIEPEAQVLFAIAGANRDPEVFDDPDRFNPDRDTQAKLSFGLGSHSCPGLHLAHTNIRVAAQVLLERLPRMTLLDEAAALPRGTTLRGPRALPVLRGPVRV